LPTRPLGARHQHLLQPLWWPLPGSSVAAPMGPALDVSFDYGGGCCWTRAVPPKGATINVSFDYGGACRRTHQQHPQGVRHRCFLQPRWWPPPDSPAAPPMGPAIDVSCSYGGGCHRTSPQHPLRGPPSTSCLATVVTAVGPAGSIPEGGPPQMTCSKW
jgi:hypothetical protein